MKVLIFYYLFVSLLNGVVNGYFWDWDRVAVVSQIKSAVQAIGGDPEGARLTQRKFLYGGPVLSQLTSAWQAVTGDLKGARETQQYYLQGVAQPLRGFYNPSKWSHWKDLRFSKGDILICTIYGPTKHVMLATSSTDIIHIILNKEGSKAMIYEEDWSTYHQEVGKLREECKNTGSQKDTSRIGPDEAVARARGDLARMGWFYYSVLSCNCEHWVFRWTTDSSAKPFSRQSLKYTNDKCPI